MEIQLPRTVDRDALLGPLLAGHAEHGSWVPLWTVDANYRRRITRRNVIRWMLVYFPHLLHGANTGGVVSVSRLHADIARAALRWEEPTGSRDAWEAPRGAAKSTWFAGCVLWALAHRHRLTAALYSDTADQVRVHIGDMRRELDRNDRLREDYPDLIPDRRVRGTVDTTWQIITGDGRSITARSMGSSDLGLKVAGGRPDLIILDDIEPAGQVAYTDRDRAQRLEKVGNVILPMNPHAVVQLVGTVTRHGSLAHDVVRASIGDGQPADWIVGMGFRPRYYPAVWHDETGVRRSLWPAAWPLEWLDHLAATEPGNYALNYLGQPPEPGGEHWTARSFRYRPDWPTTGDVVHVDPGVTVTAASDETAVCVLGRVAHDRLPSTWVQPAEPRILVHYCRGRRLTGSQLRTWLVRLLRDNPHITAVVLEENAGGDWAEILLRPRRDGRDPWPSSVRLVLYRATEPKRDRFHTLEGRYEREEIVHAQIFTELERQMTRYPHVDHDDLIDTVAGGVEYLRDPARTTAAGKPVYRVVNPLDYLAA